MIGLKRIASLIHPMRRETKTNCDSLTHILPQFASTTSLRVLIGSFVNGYSDDVWSGLKSLNYNLVPRAHVSFGQRQDTELWNNPFLESKI